MKIKVKSPANIAFIKYWGQRDSHFILPYNDSFSMNLSHCITEITIERLNDDHKKEVFLEDYLTKKVIPIQQERLEKIIDYYYLIKKFVDKKDDFGFRIFSKNNFPIKSGIASSASFYSALALGFSYLFMEKNLPEKNLSILARLSGSGSACRSIPDGFVWWKKGKNSKTSYAYSIAPPKYWDLVDLVLIVSEKEKIVGSQEGHQKALTSPFFKLRLTDLKRRIKEIKDAFLKKDFEKFGQLIEEEALSLHFVAMTQIPPLYYWSGKTIEIIKEIVYLRKKNRFGFFTIDAGENIHLICQKKDEKFFFQYFSQKKEIKKMIINYPTIGARLWEVKEN